MARGGPRGGPGCQVAQVAQYGPNSSIWPNIARIALIPKYHSDYMGYSAVLGHTWLPWLPRPSPRLTSPVTDS